MHFSTKLLNVKMFGKGLSLAIIVKELIVTGAMIITVNAALHRMMDHSEANLS